MAHKISVIFIHHRRSGQRIRTNRTCGQAIGQVSKWKRGEFSFTGCNSREMHVPKSGRSHTFWSLYGDKKARPTPLRAYGTHNDYSIFTYCTPRTWRPKAQTTTTVPDAGILFARLNWSRLPFWCAWVRFGALLRAVIVDLYCDSYCVPGPKSVSVSVATSASASAAVNFTLRSSITK